MRWSRNGRCGDKSAGGTDRPVLIARRSARAQQIASVRARVENCPRDDQVGAGTFVGQAHDDGVFFDQDRYSAHVAGHDRVVLETGDRSGYRKAQFVVRPEQGDRVRGQVDQLGSGLRGGGDGHDHTFTDGLSGTERERWSVSGRMSAEALPHGGGSMSAPLHSVPFEPIDPMVDGRSGTRLKSRHRRQNSMRTLLAQPWWMLTALVAGLLVLQVAATIGEYAFLKSSLDYIFPAQDRRLRALIAVGMLIAYATVTFVVGHRLAVAKDAVDEATERSSGWRTFGPVGAVFTVVALGSLVFMAWRRADVLAAQAAAKAVTNAETAGSLLAMSPSTLPQQELDAIAQQAHDQVWASDFWFVTGVMVLLAAVSVAVGLAMHLILRAWLVAATEMRSDRWETKAAVADTARNAAQDTLRTRIAMREERGELAHRHRDALAQRFDHAREHARVYLTQRLGSAEATSHVLPSPADIEADRTPRP